MGLADLLRRRGQVAATSAVVVPAGDGDTSTVGWSNDVWEVWRRLGEVHYSTSFMARQVGRLDWHVTVDGDLLDDDETQALLALVCAPADPQVMATEMALHMQVAGQYLYRHSEQSGWEVASGGRGAKRVDPSGGRNDYDVEFLTIRRDPADPDRPDSPVRAAMDVARELMLLSALGRAQARNRTSQRKIVLYPAEMAWTDGFDFGSALSQALTAPLTNEHSAAAVAPMQIPVPSDLVSSWSTLDLTAPFDAELPERIEHATRRLALILDHPPEILLGTADLNHWCRPAGTLAYIRDAGWGRPTVGDWIATGAGWEPVEAVYDADATGDPTLTVTVTSGVHRYRLVGTVGHRWPVVRDGIGQVVVRPQPGDRIVRAVPPARHDGQELLPDGLVALAAWYSADGTCTRSAGGVPRQVRIAKGRNWPRLAAVLEGLWGPAADRLADVPDDKPGWTVTEQRPNGVTVALLNAAARDVVLALVPGSDKAIPTGLVDLMSDRQRRLFLAAWADSDGTRQPGSLLIEQADPARLAAPERAGLLTGKALRRWVRPANSGAFSDRPIHCLRLSDTTEVTVVAVDDTVADGAVWCPTTGSGTWLALDPTSGWTDLTGNSSWQVEESTYRAHVEPLARWPAATWAKAIAAAGEVDTDRVKVVPDPGPLLTRRPTVTDTLAAFQLQLVSAEYTREILGATEQDAPAGGTPVPAPPGTAGPVVVDGVRTEPATTAAVDPDSLGERLAQIDIGLYEAGRVGVEQVIDLARGRVGAKVRTAVRADPDVTGLIDGVDNTDVVATVGTDRVAGMVDIDTVVVDTVADAVGRWWPDLLAATVGKVNDVAEIDAALAETAVTESAGLLAGLVADAVVANITTLDGSRPPAPVEAVRRAVAVAGGGRDPVVATLGQPSLGDPGGLALSAQVMEQLRTVHGLTARQGRWVYGDPGDREHPHPVHRTFAGRFTDQYGQIVRGGVTFFVGDHAGCMCALAPAFTATG